MTTVPVCKPLPVPRNVAVCPMCGGNLEIQITGWYDDGRASSDGFELDCVTEPDIGSPEWEEWFSGHYSMPYVDWLPLSVKMLKWFNGNFRVEVIE